MKTIQIAMAAALVLAVAAVAGVGQPEGAGGASADQRDGITVTGVGRVEAVPDEAEFSLGITTKGQTAREALAANSAQVRQLIAALKNAGVATKDITTQNVSVGPNYDGTANPTGYVANNSVSVRIRDLERAGAVLDAAARAGANNVYGPTLTRSDRDSLEAKALEDAVANARNRAKALAEAAGVSLGEVTAIVEGSRPEPGPIYALSERAAADTKAPIEPGTEEIQASVTVTFAIA
jgi:uncharacterized protein YggE